MGTPIIRPQKIEPKWVLVDQILCNVSDFAHLSPQKRPETICPVCQRPVILKLGSILVHHYAHQPDSICTASQPETALHLNTKFHIYSQLLHARAIYIGQNCEGCNRREKKHLWLEGWDSVEVEYRVDSFRPDIALLSKGRVIGAIEVYLSHAVTDEKIQYFDSENIAWLEVSAQEAVYEGSDAWTPEKPLAIYRSRPALEPWTCGKCQAAAEKQQKQKEYKRSNYEEIHAAKMVDFYYKSGKKFREVYYVMKKVEDNEWTKAWVKTERNQVLASETAPITQDSLRNLNNAVRRSIVKRQEMGALVDEVVKWNPWVYGKRFVARDTERYPFRYVWDERQKTWGPS
jgi:competence CoiA-like predicted nuclease